MYRRIIFIGSQNLGGLLDDGETIKNAFLKQGLSKYVDQIIEIDVRNKPTRILYLLKLLFCLIILRNSKIVMSASSEVAYKLFKVIRLLGWDMGKCYYWVIGGNFGNWIESGKFDKTLYSPLQSIIVEGESMKKQLNHCGLSNVILLPNMKPIKYIPKKEKRNDNITKFVFLSRIIPEKGVDYIIDASNQLVKIGISNFTVSFYGKLDSAYRESFIRKMTQSENLTYGGFLDLSCNAGYDELASFDTMLFPTYWLGEGFPGIVIDAYIAGLPVLASDWRLNRDLIEEGKTGFLFKVHDVEALMNVMKSVILHQIDIDTLQKNSQAKAMEFDLDKVITPQLLNYLQII